MVAWFATRPFRFASSFMLKASAATKADYARQRADPSIDADFRRQIEAEMREPNGARYKYELPLNQPHAEPRFHGRVWVLVNRHSYSNATSVAALVQDYGFGKIMGEETADVASNYASIQSFTLPATKDCGHLSEKPFHPPERHRRGGRRETRLPDRAATDWDGRRCRSGQRGFDNSRNRRGSFKWEAVCDLAEEDD
jgi:hypothetical protein